MKTWKPIYGGKWIGFVPSLAFLLGGVLLFLFLAIIQQWVLGLQMSAKGYILPVGVGGILGLVLGNVMLKLQSQTRELKLALDARDAGLRSIQTHGIYLNLLFEHAPDTIYIADMEGRIRQVNEQAIRLTGYSKEELLNLNVIDIDVEVTELAHLVEFFRTLETGKPVNFRSSHRKKDGTCYPVELSICKFESPDGPRICGISRDVSERTKVERERERLLRAINQAAETIVITNAEGLIEFVNPHFSKSTGYSREEVLGQNPRILKSGLQDDNIYREMWDTISRGGVWNGRLINRRKDGSLFTEDAVISPIFNEQEQITNYVAVKRDITREIELEAQYRQAQKMEAIGQLTGGVAHDFNNLLQVINAYSELALYDLAKDHPVRPMMVQIAQAGERAARLVSQLLAFSRRQIMRPEVMQLNDAVSEMLKMIGRVIGAHIQLDWNPGEINRRIVADRGMVEQVLMNLCVNARDAMPDGGTLTIETQLVEINRNHPIWNLETKPGDYLQLIVADTGGGIAEKDLGHIFEPFFTTKETGRGTGLGLATVYGIIKQHNGLISVDSELGKGTTFRLYWPVADTIEAKKAESREEVATGGKETILLAEDNEMVRAMTSEILRRAGYRVLTAVDGLDAVELYEKHAEMIDMIIFDVVMPRLGGREAYDRIHAMNPDLRALFASGYSDKAIHSNFVLDKELNLIQKPFKADTLLSAVRKTLTAVHE